MPAAPAAPAHGAPAALPLRTIDAQELEAVERLKAFVFGSHFTEHGLEISRLVTEPSRTWVAEDAGALVATGASLTFECSVPGGAPVPTAGIRGIGVLPTHRRRGLLTAIMRTLLDDAHERGEILSCLWPTEASIYGRYGFGLGMHHQRWELARHHSAFVEPSPAVAAELANLRLRLVSLDEAAKVLPAVYDAERLDVPGMLARGDNHWTRRLDDPGGDLTCVVVDEVTTGETVGYAAYRVAHGWDAVGPDNRLSVMEAIGRTPAAHRALWRYLCDVDLVTQVNAWGRPVDEPLPHLLLDSRRIVRSLGEAAWFRLVDAPAALMSRGYSAAHALVLDVQDDFCPWNTGRWELDTSGTNADGDHDGFGIVEPTNAAADVSLDAAALASIYLGGAKPSALRLGGRIQQHTPGAVEAMDAMFAWSRSPWAVTWF